MTNFIEIGGVTRKPLVDLTRNDPLANNLIVVSMVFFQPASQVLPLRMLLHFWITLIAIHDEHSYVFDDGTSESETVRKPCFLKYLKLCQIDQVYTNCSMIN